MVSAPKQKQKKMTKWQQYAIDNPYHRLTGDIPRGCHRRIGNYSVLVTVDLFPDFSIMPDWEMPEQPEWHVSLSVMLGLIKEGPYKGLPMSPPLYGWGDELWHRAIQQCKAILQKVGDEEGSYWMGETCSLHYRKPLTDGEIAMIPPELLSKAKPN